MKLKLGISITLFANVIFAISQWLIIAGLNYAGNTDLVGQYAYSLALAGVFLMSGQFGLRPYLLSRSISVREERYIIHTRFLTSILALTLLSVYSYIFVDAMYFNLIILLGIVKLVENMADICHGLHQKHFAIVEIAQSRILRAILTPILFFSIYSIFHNIVIASTGVLLSLLAAFYFVDKKVFSAYQVAPMKAENLALILKIARRSFPMGLASMLVILVVSIPLFILKKYHPDQDIGVYASIFYFVTAGSLVLQSVIQVISPVLTKYIKYDALSALRILIIRSYLMASMFGLIVMLLAHFFGEFLLTFLYGELFYEHAGLLLVAAIINLALAFQAVGGVVLTSFGVFKYQMYVMAAVLPVCYISSTFLIQLYGIQGALYSGVVCASIIAVLFALKIYKISK